MDYKTHPNFMKAKLQSSSILGDEQKIFLIKECELINVGLFEFIRKEMHTLLSFCKTPNKLTSSDKNR